MTDTLLIIDGHSMAFRAFFALPVDTFVTKTGQHTNAVYGFVSMLVKLIEQENPQKIAVAFDVSRHSFRTEEYPEYKGTREKTPEEFTGQIELISEVLEAMGIVSLRKEGYEADDIVATLAKRGDDEGMNILVVSGDRDTFQTVSERVTVLYPGQRSGDLSRMTPAAVEDKYGVPPQRYPEIAALIGEKSDNLPGVPGVGQKTAAQWITSFDGLENLLKRCAEVKGKRGEALRAHIEDVRRNRRLNHLLTDLDLGLKLGDLTRKKVDSDALFSLFYALEFGGLRRRVMAVLGDEGVALSSPQAADISSAEHTCASFDFTAELDVDCVDKDCDIAQWVHSFGPIRALWAEGSSVPTKGRTDLLALVGGKRVLVVDPTELSAVQDQDLGNVLREASDPVVHDAKALSHSLSAQGWVTPWPSRDVHLAAYLLRPDAKSVELPVLLESYLGVESTECEPKDNVLFDVDGEVSAPVLLAARQARALPVLWDRLKHELVKAKELELLESMEVPVARVLTRMEDTGIAVDEDVLQRQSLTLGAEVESARSRAIEVIGEEVNLSSPKQLQRILFEVLDLPKTKKTKRGYTTNAEALFELRERTRGQEGPGFVFLDNLLIHRDRIKLKQMVDSLIGSIGDDGRIHSSFSQVVAATGRLASSDPNLQNIPARTPDGVRIRSAFVPGPGYSSLMSVDYSQIEMRIMAHLSQDQGLIAAFASGEDLHRTMASMVFGVPLEEVTGEQRSRIKATSYGLAYGLSPFGLSQQLRISVPEASALRARYFERFGGVHDYLAAIVDDARTRGYTETMFGRRRYLPELTSQNRMRREMAERAALNAPIQGSAADIIKIAMVNVVDALEAAGLCSRVLVQIHDELLLEIAPGEAEIVEKLVREQMAQPVQMSVALEVSVGIGENWMAAAH